ncbi:MAG: AtpZ/AtpI family protein [Candidatus Omnitrophica bacterium]|nr:AtpZ/AtpI family protein [Candidatus Omnitrophota bacterium]
MAGKTELYKIIKIAGMISYIPIMLAAAPLGGFFLGEYLRNKFHLPFYFLVLCVLLGIALGIKEVIRVIRLVWNIENKN